MMRVGLLGIQHESNTFHPEPTELRDFQAQIFTQGEDVRRKFAGAHHEVTGFLQGLEKNGIEAMPLFVAFALPAGAVSDEALDELWRVAAERIASAGALDGFLVAAHGAAVNVSRPDMDGWWLGELRKLAGPGRPIITVVDPHANFTLAMAASCDAVIAYRENPHIDQRQRGLEAADLMARTLCGDVKPCLEASFPPVTINIERQLTGTEPMASIERKLDSVRAEPGVLSASLMMGYCYADVPEMGAAFVVVTDDDAGRAKQLANELGNFLYNVRDRLQGHLVFPEQALRDALTADKPAALLDMGDNIGGGAPGDSTVLAQLCLALKPGITTFVCLFDPESVFESECVGIGGTATLRMGGKQKTTPAPPLLCEVTVRSLHNGSFRDSEPRHGGFVEFSMGRTAIVTTEQGMTIMLTSRPVLPASPQQMISCGLDPKDFDLLILKGVHLPVAAYKDICLAFLRVNTPGITTAEMNTLSYEHRRQPLYPFEELTDLR